MTVEPYMTPAPASVSIDSTLEHAAELMWNGDFGVLPVVDGDGRVYAMLTDRDICMAAYTQGVPLREIPVRTAMSSSIVTVHPSDSLGHAEAVMAEHRVRRLPVVDALGRLLGLLSLSDLVRPASVGATDAGLRPRDVTTTLARITEPNRPRQPLAAVG